MSQRILLVVAVVALGISVWAARGEWERTRREEAERKAVERQIEIRKCRLMQDILDDLRADNFVRFERRSVN